MTDRNKFEEMLERLVNEDREGAEELFHEIVVEKSRDIYEALLSEEEDEEEDKEVDEAADEEVDESEEELDESSDDDLDESDDEDLDESDDEDLDEGFFGEGDPTDDMLGDIEMPGDEMGMDAGDEMGAGDDMGMDMDDAEGGEIEDRVMDLEDELEALKAEFETLMGDESSEDDGDMDMDMDGEEGEDDGDEEGEMDFGGDEEEPEEESIRFEGKKSSTEMMREYADKVAPAKMGDNGANAKSTVAGKNDMGGTTANIVGGDTEAGVEANKGKLKGSALSDQTAKDMNTKNVNVPGAKGATKMSNQPGHGAEKKGKPETADKGASSPLNGAPKRAK